MNDVEQLWQHPALARVDPSIGDVPALGAHSRMILRALGYSPHEIGELIAASVTSE